MPVEYVFIVWIFSICLAIAFFYFFNRWVFSINRQLKNQEMMIFLLKEIAKKNGVTNEIIEIKENELYERD